MKYFILAALLAPCSFVHGIPAAPHAYRLRMFNTHTLEHIDIIYRRDGSYDREALAKLDRFLRDWRADAVKHYDPRLFDLLAELTAKANRPEAEIYIICGYRTPQSNGLLRSRSSAVARNSLHMAAEAIDIRLPGVPTSTLRDTALALRRGGVGYYAASDFVHVDVGRVRRW